ncbi:MAG TPA: cytochrome b/b6 domain-containing protein [Anaerolineae bacterium]
MSTEVLTLAERKRLRAKKIKKHGLANIVTHWFNAVSWFVLLLTGLGILGNPDLRIMPQGYVDFMRNLFGGIGGLVESHKIFGMIWLLVITYNVLLGFRRYFVPFARKRMLLTPDDIEWLKKYGQKLVGKKVTLPPQDAYNAGQKLYGYVVILGTVTIGLTGLIMTFSTLFPPEMRWIVQWARPFHFGAAGLVVAGLIIHVYMAAFFPEEKSAFFSMIHGEVDALYARLHHKKWYDEKVAEERDYEMRVRLEEIEAKEKEAEGING